jgi:hypothetical protein
VWVVTDVEDDESSEEQEDSKSKHNRSLTPDPSLEERGVYSIVNNFFMTP